MSICSLGQGAQSPEVAMPSIRNKLGNTFATMQEDGKTSNMKVFARLRPMLQREKDAGDRECFAVIDGQVVRATVPNTSVILKNFSQNSQEEIYEDFTYTQAFGPEIGQFVFFRHAVSDIMQSFIEGQNCLIFSSGITNSGKIFTLQGSEGNPGVIPIAMCLFFTSIKHQVFTRTSVKPDNFADILILEDKDSTSETKLKEQLIQLSEQESANKTNSSGNLTESFPFDWCHCFNDDFQYGTDKSLSPEEMKDASAALYMKELSKLSADKQEGLCSIWVSFVEIYDENIYDLLQPDISNRAKLTLVEDQNGEVYVKGAIEICVSSSEEALKLLKLGRRNLRIAANKFNNQFSRSHCIFTVKVIRMDSKENRKVNRISFCDLAGSEHADKYQTSGMHLNEAEYNNTSLLVLGKCLEQLRLNQSMQDKKTLPIKESTLTRLFSSHLLGKGRVVMIVNASPCEYTFDDTLNVLRFSALLKTVKLNNSYLSAVSSSLQNIVDNLSKSRDHFSDVPHIESINTDNSLCEDIHEKDMIDVKLNNSYLSAVSSSLQNIADNLSKSRAYLSHVLHNETINFDHSLWEGIEEREDMIDKLLGLADSLRSNLEAENRAKADLELNIRQAVCRECAKYSDQLLEEQKKICAAHIDSLKKVNELKVSNMENMYEKRIDDLLSQLQEYESCPDESSTSINKGNSTLEAKEAQNSKILLASGVPDMAAESRKSPMPVERSVLAILMEECDSLLFKLEKAEAALTERTKEFDLFKSESLKKDIEIESLKKEKKSLEDFVSEKITKLEKSPENEKAMKKYAEKNAELEESISEKESRIKELTQIVQTLEIYKAEFQNNEIDIVFNKEEVVILKEELGKAKLLKEQSDLLCECLERCEFLASNKIKLLGSSSVKHLDEITDMRKQIKEKNASIGELKKGISGKEGRIKELTESIQTLENYKAEFQSIEIDIASYKKEIVNLKEELDKTKSLKDNSDVLCEYLERCEFLAYNKIKLLNSSSIKNLNEITDMRRQIKEKNARIGELEKALRDSQKQVESAPSLQNDVKPQIVCVRKFIRSKVTPIATAITEKPLPKVSKPSTDKMLRNMSNGQTKSANYIEPGERPMSRENTARKVLKRSNSQSAFEVVNTLTNSSKPQCASTGSKIETMTASQQHPVTNTADVAAFKLHELTITLPNANTVVENVKVLPTARKSCDSQPLPNGTGNPSKHFKPTPMSTPKLHAEVDKKMNAGITNANRTSNPLTPESHNQIKLMAAVTTIVPTSSATLVPMAKVPPSLSISRILPDVSVHLSEKGTYPLNEKGHPLSEKSANSKITVTKSEESTRTFKEDVLTSLLVSLGKSGVTVANFSMNETIPETRIAAKSSTDKKELQTIILVNDGTTIENSLSNVANVNKLTDESRASTGRSSQKKPVFKEKSVVSSTDSDVVIRHVADRTKLGEPAKLLNKNKVTHIKLNNGKIIKDGSTVASETSSELMASNNIKNDEVNNISKDSSIKNSTTSIKETLLDKIVNSLIVDELVNKSKDIASDSSRTPVSNRRRSLGTTRPPKVFYNSNDLVAAKRQNAPRIQQIQHQKRLLDANIYKLKMNLQQAHEQVSNKTWNAGRKASNAKDEAKHSSNTSKGGNKRSLSDVNKEDAVNTGENETSPKRRRSLRATQPPTAIRISDDLKAESKVIEPPKLRTSQRKLQEQKKNSSVKKAMQFMGSEIRSAAQSVSSMPTPRVTRGLIKLFNTPRVTRGRIKLLNTDAACKRAGPKWRP